MELTHLGHACLLVQTDGARLVIDPGTMSDFADLRDLDAVLITHQHADHLDQSRLRALVEANPGARLVADPDSEAILTGLGLEPEVARVGHRFDVGGSTIEVLGGIHATVYADVPGCTNAAYLIDQGALLHPGDSFLVPDREVDVVAVAIDAPWLKLAEAVDYVRAVSPRVAIPVHEGEARDPGKYTGMLEAFAPEGVVHTLPRGRAAPV